MSQVEQPKVLFVDDEENIRKSLKRTVHGMDIEAVFAENAAEGLALLEQQPFDIVVSDKSMPGMNGNEFLQKVAEQWPEVVRIMLTAYTDLRDLIHAVNSGRIWGYLEKPWDNKQLILTLEQAIQLRNVLAERSLLRMTLARYQGGRKRNFQRFIGDSDVMQQLYTAIEQCAPSHASVFITGPSGAGKELAALAIHQLSPRQEKDFIAINCAAIPTELMESEIFGHVKGAFSGAVSNRDGAATLADGGTLFLDEIGEMDMNLQAKLLRFIQTGTFQKVGSGKTEKVDIRFVCATNREPLDAIAEKKMREDLYYRLNVISLHLPPLAQRGHDPLKIAKYFLNRFSDLEDKTFVGFSAEVEQIILGYSWPGNVRQLQNVIHCAVVMSEGPLVTEQILMNQLKLTPEDMPGLSPKNQVFGVENSECRLATPVVQHHAQTLSPESHIRPLAEVERETIERAIDLCEGNVVKAASLLCVSPSTLYRKIQQWDQTEG